MHIYPGINYYDSKIQNFWLANYTSIFESILTSYESDIQLISGAHIHRTELKSPKSGTANNT